MKKFNYNVGSRSKPALELSLRSLVTGLTCFFLLMYFAFSEIFMSFATHDTTRETIQNNYMYN